MDVIENEDMKQSIITLEDFPLICRICCLKRSDLRLFEEEDYLFDLFHTIRKIDACSRVAFPRNICNGCVSKLEDISMFIDISKYSDPNFGKNMQPKPKIIECANEIESGMSRELIKENGDPMIFKESEICRFCSSSSSGLTSFEEKSHLMQVFQKITDIDLKADFSGIVTICSKCNNELENISSFINSSLSNDQKLENVIGTKSIVETDYVNPMGTGLSMVPTMTEDTFNKKSFLLESKEKLEIVDIKKKITDSKFSTSIEQNYQKKSISHSRTSPERNNFEIDVDLKTKNGEKRFKCDFCEKRFKRKWNFQKHLLIHTGIKSLKCDYCEKRFLRKSNLQNHLFIHSGKKPFKCDSCEKSFRLKSNMKQHMMTHSGEKPFKCDSCEKSFTSKFNMKQHMMTHSGIKLFKCDCCGKKFCLKKYFQAHLLTHTRERLFRCNYCKKPFYTKTHLRTHLRTHTEEKLFKCNCCEKYYTRERSLRQHMLIHSEDNPFKCDSCNKGFSEKHHLQQHLLVHFEEKLFRCEYCEKGFLLKQSLQKHYVHSHENVSSK